MQTRWIPADPATLPAPLWVLLLPLIAAGLFVGYLGGSSVMDAYHLQTRGQSATTVRVTVTPQPKLSSRVDVWFKTADGHLANTRLKRYRDVESDQEIQIEYDPGHLENAQQVPHRRQPQEA